MLKLEFEFRKFPHSILLLFSIFVLVRSVGSANGTVKTYYANDYNILNGTHLSGSVPSSIASVDSDYFIVRSAETSTSFNTYNPSAYAFLGSTSWVSGSVSDLTSNDGVNMVFRSYFSGTDIEDYVDNNTSDVDASADKGTHSNFTAQQYGPDLINDTLTEENTGGGSGTFGNTVGGGTRYTINQDEKQGSKFTLTENANVISLTFYGHIGGGAPAPYVVKGAIYSDNAGAPDALLGTTQEITISGTLQWWTASFSSPLSLNAGTYWLVIHSGTKTDMYGDAGGTNQMATNADTYSDGPSDPFGAPTYSNVDLSIYASYSTANYELDLEVQWTSVDFDESNEQLCIYGGTMGAENIRVDVWNGIAWQNLFAVLTSGWNNVSVTSYLDSSTFTIRFKGSIETGDTTQDTWNIDAVLLHMWTDQYTAEVEFAGFSNTYSWKQLNWAIDSAWTIGSVNVTIQLYNYALGNYPTSGNGYLAYISSSTPNTDDTKYQLVMSNPQDFRNSTGGWKIKVKGVKNTGSEFDFKVDLLEFKPKHRSEYIVSTEFLFSSLTGNTSTQLNFTVVSQYSISSVNVSVQIWNYFTSTYSTSGEGYLTYTSLGSNETKTLNINTDPRFYTSDGNAKIKITGILATSNQFQQEVNQVILTVSTQTITQPFNWFTTLLYVLPLVFAIPFLLILKFKRRKKIKPHIGKKPDAFSKSFGMTHQQMIGKKMLLEIDPKSDYQNALFNFVSEARNSDEALLIITGMNSALHSATSGTENVKSLLTSLKTSRIQQINEMETLLPAADLSVLLGAIGRAQKVQTDKTVNMLFDNLSDIILTCGFEKTYKFIRLLLEAISSPKTTALFVFNPAAHDPTISSSIRGLFQIHLAYTKRGPNVETL